MVGMRILYTNIVSFQHIEALRHLVIHAGPSLWDGNDSDWSDSEIYMTAITQIVPLALNGQPLYDFLPERSGRWAAARCCSDLKNFFDRLSVGRTLEAGGMIDSGPSLLPTA
jgi:hypothetical protein